jgi:hypothetical protein
MPERVGRATTQFFPVVFCRPVGQDARRMGREIHYDLMLEVEGIMRSRSVRMRLDRELEAGETIDLNGRRWQVTRIGPARSLHVDRRVVAREIVEPVAA